MMTQYNDITIRFRVFDLGPKDEYEDIYQDLYQEDYQEFAFDNDLICCELTCPRELAEHTFNALYALYEGYCYTIYATKDGDEEHIIGGTFDKDDFEYLKEWMSVN